jgi:hypothetical protein
VSLRPVGSWDEFFADDQHADPCTDPCCPEHGCGGMREDCACRTAEPEWKEELPWNWTRD